MHNHKLSCRADPFGKIDLRPEDGVAIRLPGKFGNEPFVMGRFLMIE